MPTTNVTKPEIQKIFVASIKHISKEDRAYLEQSCVDFSTNIDLITYQKATYGWFFTWDDHFTRLDNIPQSIRAVIEFAKLNHCSWIMIDVDGPTYPEIQQYEGE